MKNLDLLVLSLILILASQPMEHQSARANAHSDLPCAATQTPQKKKDNKARKGKKQPVQQQKKGKKKAQSAKKQTVKSSVSNPITKSIGGISVSFPTEPTVRTYEESVTYSVITTHSALTIMHLRKIKTDGELVYFSPEYKNSERWKQEVMAYQEMQKIGINYLKLPAHWQAKDYKTTLGKLYVANYKAESPKARQGRIIALLEQNAIVIVQATTMKAGQAGVKERNAFMQSVKIAEK